MAQTYVRPLPGQPDDGRDAFIGRHSTSLGQELPARQEGFISQNSLFDRRNAESQKREGGSQLALHQVHDATDLDVLPNEIAFVRKKTVHAPYDPAKKTMTILTSLNGMVVDAGVANADDASRAKNIEGDIIPVGIACDRIPYQNEGEFQMPRAPIAVQISGKTTLRSQREIPVGTMVRAHVPTQQEVRERTSSNRVGGRPASKVVLELEPVSAESFAARTLKAIQARADANANPTFITPKDIALKKIEDAAILNYYLQRAMTDDLRPDEQDDVIDMIAQSPVDVPARQETLRTIFSPDEKDAALARPDSVKLRVYFINAQLGAFSGYADMMRIEDNFMLGKCTQYKKGVVDVLL